MAVDAVIDFVEDFALIKARIGKSKSIAPAAGLFRSHQSRIFIALLGFHLYQPVKVSSLRTFEYHPAFSLGF